MAMGVDHPEMPSASPPLSARRAPLAGATSRTELPCRVYGGGCERARQESALSGHAPDSWPLPDYYATIATACARRKRRCGGKEPGGVCDSAGIPRPHSQRMPRAAASRLGAVGSQVVAPLLRAAVLQRPLPYQVRRDVEGYSLGERAGGANTNAMQRIKGAVRTPGTAPWQTRARVERIDRRMIYVRDHGRVTSASRVDPGTCARSRGLAAAHTTCVAATELPKSLRLLPVQVPLARLALARASVVSRSSASSLRPRARPREVRAGSMRPPFCPSHTASSRLRRVGLDGLGAATPRVPDARPAPRPRRRARSRPETSAPMRSASGPAAA